MKKILLSLIKFYKKHVSAGSPPKCRFIPSCSTYAAEAIEKYGAFKGLRLTVWRILRCNPFNRGDIYDPLP